MRLRTKKRNATPVMLLLPFLILLCGCGGAEHIHEPESSPDTVAVQELAAVKAEPMHARVFFNRDARVFTDPQSGEKPIFTFSIDTPVVFIDGNDAAAEKINAFLAGIDEKIVPGNDGSSTEMDAMTYYLSLAEDFYTAYAGTDLEDSCSFSYIRTARVIRCDSMFTEFEYTLYISSPDGIEQEKSLYCFESATGEPVTDDGASAYVWPGEGYIGVFPMNYAGEDATDVIDMIEADENGQDYLIRAIGSVDELEINEIFYNDDCTEYSTGRCLYYCSRLTDEGIQLRYSIPETIPNLEIRFNMHGRSVGNVITSDGQTGTIALKITENPASFG